MSIVADGSGDWARATLSGIVNAGQKVFLSLWFKWNNATASGLIASISAGSSGASMTLEYSSTPQFRSQVNAANTLNDGTPINGTWQHLAAFYGPWNATSNPRRLYLNGVQSASSNLSITTSSADLSRLTFFGSNHDTPLYLSAGKVAHALLHAVADTAAADALAALCYTQAVTPTALGFTPAWSRTLVDDLTTGAGSGDPALTNATIDSADNPSVSFSAPVAGHRRVQALIGM